MSVREKEEFATTLVHAMHKLGKAKGFLGDIVMCEIGRLGQYEFCDFAALSIVVSGWRLASLVGHGGSAGLSAAVSGILLREGVLSPFQQNKVHPNI